MKLHLPKQLFTALITAITLATPAWAGWGVKDSGVYYYLEDGHDILVQKESNVTAGTVLGIAPGGVNHVGTIEQFIIDTGDTLKVVHNPWPNPSRDFQSLTLNGITILPPDESSEYGQASFQVDANNTVIVGTVNGTLTSIVNAGTLTLGMGKLQLGGNVTNTGTLHIAGIMTGVGENVQIIGGNVNIVVDSSTIMNFERAGSHYQFYDASGNATASRYGFLQGTLTLHVLDNVSTNAVNLTVNGESGSLNEDGTLVYDFGTDNKTFYVAEAWTYNTNDFAGATDILVSSTGTLTFKDKGTPGVAVSNHGTVVAEWGKTDIALWQLVGKGGFYKNIHNAYNGAFVINNSGVMSAEGDGVSTVNIAMGGRVILNGAGTDSKGSLGTAEKAFHHHINLENGTTLVLQNIDAYLKNYNSDNRLHLNGWEIGAGATLYLTETDTINYNAHNLKISEGGVLDVQERQSINASSYIELAGGTIRGAGGVSGNYTYGLDFYSGGELTVAATSSIETNVGGHNGGTVNFIVSQGATLNMSGNLVGLGEFKKSGKGNMVYTGGAFTQTLTIGDGEFEYNLSTGERTHSGKISGIGKFAKSGKGTLTLSGANDYSGGTIVESGKLVAASAGALGSGNVTVNQDATLELQAEPSNPNDLFGKIKGYGSLVINQDVTLGNGIVSEFLGDLIITGKHTLTLGASQDYGIDLSSFKKVILNNGGQISYQANGASTFKNVTVDEGSTGTFYSIDTDADTIQFAGETSVSKDATLEIGANWNTALNIENLTGAGTLKVNSADSPSYADIGVEMMNLTIGSLSGFTGDLSIDRDTVGGMTVVINTGDEAVKFNKLEVLMSVTDKQDRTSYVFNVGTDTEVAEVNAAPLSINIAEGKTLTLGGGTAETPVKHNIGGMSAKNGAGVSLGDYATLTLASLTVENGQFSFTGAGNVMVSNVDMKAATSLVLGNGTQAGEFSLNNLTAAGNLITIGEKAMLKALTLTAGSTVNLAGTGVYVLGDAATALPAGVTLADGWKGAVRLSGEYTELNLDGGNLYNAESWVELAGVSGYLSLGNAVSINANIRLTDVGDKAAINHNNGNKGDIRTFNGKIEGTGTWERTRYNGTVQSYVFAGDVSGWKGAFINCTPASGNSVDIVTNLTFQGASDINVNISNPGDGESAGALNVTINDANRKDETALAVNGSIQASKLTVDTKSGVDFTNNVTVDTLVVNQGKLAMIGGADNTLQAGEVAISRAGAALSNVTVSGSSIQATSTSNGAVGSIANALVELGLPEMAAGTRFTIEDMTLTNVELKARTPETRVYLNNVSGSAILTTGTFVLDAKVQSATSIVGEGGTASVLAYGAEGAPSLTLNAGSMVLLTADPTQDVNGAFGTYTLTFTLNVNLGESLTEGPVNWSSLVGFDGWLGSMLATQMPDTLNVGELPAELSQDAGPSVSYNYTAGEGSNVGSLVITINGLNVPEPATSTLSLMALMALAARRRRKK